MPGEVSRIRPHEFQLIDGRLITVEIPQDRFTELAASVGHRLFVSPRCVHVF